MYERLHIIINPASGREKPVLSTMNRVFREVGIDWAVSITQKSGDARRLARAAAATADVVAVYGGDGTVAEVAGGLLETGVPLAILPGGTANVMAIELGIPSALAAACKLACGSGSHIRRVDLGWVNEHSFLLRVGVGLEAEMVEGADRESKGQVGVLAYLLSALQSLSHPTPARYQLELDGRSLESEGLTCLIANSGNMGRPGLSLHPQIVVDDGLLDVVVIRQTDLRGLLAITADITRLNNEEVAPTHSDGIADEQRDEPQAQRPIQHWQVKEVHLVADPPQTIQCDGEILDAHSIQCKVLPQAIGVLVPDP